MHDIKGYHRISNPNDGVAVTMHVYSPPYKLGSIIVNGTEKKLVEVKYDSEGGILKEDCTPSELRSITENSSQ